MAKVHAYKLPPTKLVPNSPYPLLHYRGFLPDSACSATDVHALFASHGWQTQWVARYAARQDAHYHSGTHECMAVLSGSATIRFGAADTDPDTSTTSTSSSSPSASPAETDPHEPGGIEIHAQRGDVFVLPAGLAHKTFAATPDMPFDWLLPADDRGLGERGAEAEAQREALIRGKLERMQLSGFAMLGAYPTGGVWDFARGGDSEGRYESVWSTPVPEEDPVLGGSEEGLRGLWGEGGAGCGLDHAESGDGRCDGHLQAG